MTTTKKVGKDENIGARDVADDSFEGEILLEDAQGNALPKLNILADVELFSVDLIATLQRDKESLKMLIMPGADIGKPVKLSDLSEQLGSPGITTAIEEFAASMEEYIGLDINQITLQQVFFYYDSGSKDKKEYAIAIKIGNKKQDTEKFMFAIKTVAVAIYNTERKAIIDQMNLVSVDDFLKRLDK